MKAGDRVERDGRGADVGADRCALFDPSLLASLVQGRARAIGLVRRSASAPESRSMTASMPVRQPRAYSPGTRPPLRRSSAQARACWRLSRRPSARAFTPSSMSCRTSSTRQSGFGPVSHAWSSSLPRAFQCPTCEKISACSRMTLRALSSSGGPATSKTKDGPGPERPGKHCGQKKALTPSQCVPWMQWAIRHFLRRGGRVAGAAGTISRSTSTSHSTYGTVTLASLQLA